MRHLVVGIIYQRVVGLILYRCVDASRLLSVDTVESDTVIHHLIMFPYSLLQRVHLGGIGLRTDDFIAERIDKDGVAHSHGSRIHLSLLVFLLEGIPGFATIMQEMAANISAAIVDCFSFRNYC